MDGPDQDRSPLGRVVAALVGAGLLVVGATAVARGSDTSVEPDPEPAVEVCDTTEYQGCPQRWEYLWVDE